MKAFIRILAALIISAAFVTVPAHASGSGSVATAGDCPPVISGSAGSSGLHANPCTSDVNRPSVQTSPAPPPYAQPVVAAAVSQNTAGSIITVTGTDDDATVANLNGNGTCDLREALQNANSNSGTAAECGPGTGTDTIRFVITGGGAQTISVDYQLDVTDPVLIDGTTEGGYSGTPLIRLEGGSTLVGLRFFAGSEGSTLQGLMMTGFDYAGVMIFTGDSSNHVTLLNNYIGTDGTSPLGNSVGVWIFGGQYAQIGGPSASDRNIISGNGTNIQVSGDAGTNRTGDYNTIRGNFIGLNSSGTAIISGSAFGIAFTSVLSIGASHNSVLFNVIAGANNADVSIQSAENDSNIFQGNMLGTNAAGSASMGDFTAFAINAGDNNVIGGNGDIGKRNLISGMGETAIYVVGGSGTQIVDNVLGMNADGTGQLPNTLTAIEVASTDVKLTRNWIAGTAHGVWLHTGATLAAGSANNCLTGNSLASGAFTNDTGVLMTFENNWWGSASGPSGAGSGSGDSVSADVDFTPWATSRQPICSPEAYIGVSSLDFGTQLAGTSATQSVTILNKGPAPLHFSSLGGAGLPFLVIPGSSTCSTSTPLAFGTTCDIAVQFAPSSTGAFLNTLVLGSDSNPVPAALPLTGTGIGVQHLANPSFEIDGNNDHSPDNWSLTNFNVATDGRECYAAITYIYGQCAFKLAGNSALKTASQTILASGGPGDEFTFALQNGTASVPGGATVRFTVDLFNGVTPVATQTLNFSTGTHGFERQGGSLIAPGSYDTVVYTIAFQAASGTAWFDVASLYTAP